MIFPTQYWWTQHKPPVNLQCCDYWRFQYQHKSFVTHGVLFSHRAMPLLYYSSVIRARLLCQMKSVALRERRSTKTQESWGRNRTGSFGVRFLTKPALTIFGSVLRSKTWTAFIEHIRSYADYAQIMWLFMSLAVPVPCKYSKDDREQKYTTSACFYADWRNSPRTAEWKVVSKIFYWLNRIFTTENYTKWSQTLFHLQMKKSNQSYNAERSGRLTGDEWNRA